MYTGFVGMCLISFFLAKQNFKLLKNIEELIEHWDALIELAEAQQKMINELKEKFYKVIK